MTRARLKYVYLAKNMSLWQIAESIGCGTSSIMRAVKRFGLHKGKNLVYKQIDERRRQTFKARYGAKHYMQSRSGFLRYQRSIRRSLGVKNIMGIDSVKSKVENTHLSRYGVRYSIQNPASNKCRIETLNRKYGDYRLYLSRKCAQNHVKTSPGRMKIATRLGNFCVRSQLESHVIRMLCKMPDVHELKYEPFIIELDNGFAYVPDVIVNGQLVLEVKYHKYISSKRPNNLDVRGNCMWESTLRKLPCIRRWCKKHRYNFGVVTERDLRHLYLYKLVANLKVFDQNRPAF
jgi:hypothetical protein